MDIILNDKTWYEITLSHGKSFKAFHSDGELIFTDGSMKLSGDVVPYADRISQCEEPKKIRPISDYLADEAPNETLDEAADESEMQLE